MKMFTFKRNKNFVAYITLMYSPWLGMMWSIIVGTKLEKNDQITSFENIIFFKKISKF